MLKKLAVGCLLLMVFAAAGIWAAWRQLTRLPEWYSPAAAELAAGERSPTGASAREVAPAEPSPSPDDRTAPRRPTQEPNPADRPLPMDELRGGSGRIELDECQLNELLIGAVEEHRNGRRVRRAAKAVRASIHGDRLEIGVVTSLANLAAVAESADESEVIRRLGRLAPWLEDRDFYLAARGRPGVKNGHLFFDRELELVIGGVGLNAADTAARLGVPQHHLDAGAELPIPGLRLEHVEIGGGSVILSLAE